MKPQPEPTLLEFVHYNAWANQRLLALCMELDEGVIAAEIPHTAGSIRQTFSHLLRAQAGFLVRIHGTALQPAFSWDGEPSLVQLASYARVLDELFLETVQTIAPTANVHEENEQWLFDYQARLIFMSQIYHGITHRTDIMTFLGRQGVELPELDVWGYQEAHPERFQARLVRRTAD